MSVGTRRIPYAQVCAIFALIINCIIKRYRCRMIFRNSKTIWATSFNISRYKSGICLWKIGLIKLLVPRGRGLWHHSHKPHRGHVTVILDGYWPTTWTVNINIWFDVIFHINLIFGNISMQDYSTSEFQLIFV